MNIDKEIDGFFSKMLGRSDVIYKEIDCTLQDTRGHGVLSYPRCIWNLINVKAVKRMSRILQTGTKVYAFPGMSHTRLEHSKGTYYRTLELLQKLYSQEKIGNLIEKNNYQKYVIAELVRALLHDVGHGPFSHTMEVVCNLPKGFHEKIGTRLIKEEPELREALDEIYPGLSELIEEVIERNFLGLNRIFEGQIDLDRGDFLPRDSYCANIRVRENSKIVSELFDHVSIQKIVKKDGNSIITPVFEANQLQNLERFFENRYKNYKDIYYDAKSSSKDFILKAFANRLVEGEEQFKLRDFLTHNMNKKPEEIDLQEYICYDDIEFLKGIIEVSENTADPILKKLALLSLPPREAIDDIFWGLMISIEQIDEDRNRAYTNESDEQFIKKLELLPDLKREYEENITMLNSDNPNDVEAIKKEIKAQLQVPDEILEKLGVMFWESKVATYRNKEGEETYVKDEDGKIYEYSEHPKRKAPIQEKTISGFFLLVPLLEANGYSNEKINQLRDTVENYNKKLLLEQTKR